MDFCTQSHQCDGKGGVDPDCCCPSSSSPPPPPPPLPPSSDNAMSQFRIGGRFSRVPNIFVAPWLHILTNRISDEDEEKEEEGEVVEEEKLLSVIVTEEEETVGITLSKEVGFEKEGGGRRGGSMDLPGGNLKTSTSKMSYVGEDLAVGGGGSGGGGSGGIELGQTGQMREHRSSSEAEGGGGGDRLPPDFRLILSKLDNMLEEQRKPPPRGRNPLTLQRSLAQLLRLEHAESDLDEAIVLDVFVVATRWAADALFDPLQTALFLHLLQRLHAEIEAKPDLENLVETLHGHVYHNSFYEMFQEAQIVDMIDYIAEAVLKPFRLYRLYSLISFVHEGADNPEIIKKSGKSVHDVFLRYDVSASVVVPDINVLPVATSPTTRPSEINANISFFEHDSLVSEVEVDIDDNNIDDDDRRPIQTSSPQRAVDVLNYGSDYNFNVNATLDLQHLVPSSSGTALHRRRSSLRRKNFNKHQASGDTPPPPPPPCIPPLCDAIPIELYERIREMEEEAERARKEEEERYALLNPKILTSAEQLDQMLEILPAQELVDLVTTTVTSRLKEVSETLGQDLKRQENAMDEKVEAIDTMLREKAEGGGVVGGKAKSRMTVKSQKSKKSKKSKK